jgi:hypothetical protein
MMNKVVGALAVAVLLALAGAGSGSAQSASPTPTPPPLAPGDVVPAFDTVSVDGVARRIEYPKGSHTVVVFFTSSCPVCHRMLPVWSDYYRRLPKSLAMVGVVVDREPPGFWSAMPVGFPVVRSPGRDLLRSYKVSHVPMTIRIGPGGKVEEAAEGILDPIRLGQIFRP